MPTHEQWVAPGFQVALRSHKPGCMDAWPRHGAHLHARVALDDGLDQVPKQAGEERDDLQHVPAVVTTWRGL